MAGSIPVDYVLVFSFCSSLKLYKSNPSKAKEELSQAKQEYQGLCQKLRDVGLQVTGRRGAREGEVLIFVKCDDDRIQQEVERERLSDWLHGVSSTSQDPLSKRDFLAQPITPSERLRLIYSIITHPQSLSSAVSPNPSAGITPQSPTFPHLLSIFPPHDEEFNKEWLKQWNRLDAKRLIGIPEADLLKIKNHFGEAIAFYFEFLRFYFASLVFPTLMGLIIRLLHIEFSAIYSLGVMLWSIIFVRLWRVRERSLAVKWGVKNCSKVEIPRAGYKPSGRSLIEVKDEKDEEREVRIQREDWIKREVKILSSIPALLLFAAGLSVLVTGIYTAGVILNEVYDGPFKQYLTLVPTVIFATVVPQIVGTWRSTAMKFTEWENHSRDTSFERSLTLKVFALNFIVAYGDLFLTSYIYIPFASVLVPHIVQLISYIPAFSSLQFSSTQQLQFSVNHHQLQNSVFAYTATNQVVSFFLEVGLPYVLRFASKQVEIVENGGVKKMEEKMGIKVAKDEADEKEFLDRIRKESELPEYSLFVEFAEMVVQFGYVVLWSVIWPLASLSSFINNFFELRSDAFKLCVHSRRPIPIRSDTIGSWLYTLDVLTWMGALTNSSLIYLFAPSSANSRPWMIFSSPFNSTATPPAGPSTPSPSPNLSSVRFNLFSALLIALAFEHLYIVVKLNADYIVEQLFWQASEEKMYIEQGDVALKKTYLKVLGMDSVEKGAVTVAMEKRDGMKGTSGGVFWEREDRGAEEMDGWLKKD